MDTANALNPYHGLNKIKLNRLLIEGANTGNLVKMNQLLEAGAGVNAANAAGVTPLIAAASTHGQVAMVKFLIKKGANVNAATYVGTTALIEATLHCDMDIIKFLLKAGANANAVDQLGRTAFLTACDALYRGDIIFYLLSAMSDEQIDKDAAFSPSIKAIVEQFNQNMLKNRAKLFSIFGAYVMKEDAETFLAGQELKMIASQLSKSFPTWYAHQIESELRLVFNIFDQMKENKETAALFEKLYHVNAEEKLDIIQALGKRYTYRSCATHLGYRYAAKVFVSDVQTAIFSGLSSLNNQMSAYISSFFSQSKEVEMNKQKSLDSRLFEATKNRDIHLVRNLLRQGANPNAIRCYENPLHYAASNGDIGMVHVLLKAGTNPNRGDYNGNTPLHVAAQKGHSKLIPFLINRGADFFALNQSGATLLHKACCSNNLETVIMVLSLHDKNDRDLNVMVDIENQTPLHYASSYGCTEIVDFLLQQGANIEAQKKGIDGKGNTPLHEAALSGHVEVIDVLLQRGATIEDKNKEGETPLHVACWNGNSSAVTFLLQKGANKYHLNKKGKSPFDYAVDELFFDSSGSGVGTTDSEEEADNHKDNINMIFCFLAFMSDEEIKDAQKKYNFGEFNDLIEEFNESIFLREKMPEAVYSPLFSTQSKNIAIRKEEVKPDAQLKLIPKVPNSTSCFRVLRLNY